LEVKKEEMSAQFARQVIHADTMTLARVYLKKGCTVPAHQHPSEQLSIIESGALRFLLGGQEVVVKAGETLRIPANLPHSAEALEDTVGFDVFSPLRLDWLQGDDSYLRK
jgi:quercetin dioxygenase-like cupin family protein